MGARKTATGVESERQMSRSEGKAANDWKVCHSICQRLTEGSVRGRAVKKKKKKKLGFFFNNVDEKRKEKGKCF